MTQSTFIYVGPQAQPSKTEEADIGCWLDCSSNSATTLSYRIIRELLEIQYCKFFIDTDMDRWVSISRRLHSAPGLLETADDEWLFEVSESAVEWLNENKAGEGSYFIVEDNSLYLSRVVDADSLGL